MASNKNEVAVNPTEATSPAQNSPPPKKKRRCNWNPSIWFEIENVVKVIGCGGAAFDILCLAFWGWAVAITRDATLVIDMDPIQVKMLIIHAFILATEMLLFFAVTMKSHILAYIWIFFRMIWFYYSLVVLIVGVNVLQMNYNKEWNDKPGNLEGQEVFLRLGVGDKGKMVLIQWWIAFFGYIVLVIIYSWATVIVAVFTCNTLEDFRRMANRAQSLAVSGMAAETVRRLSMLKRPSQVQEV